MKFKANIKEIKIHEGKNGKKPVHTSTFWVSNWPCDRGLWLLMPLTSAPPICKNEELCGALILVFCKLGFIHLIMWTQQPKRITVQKCPKHHGQKQTSPSSDTQAPKHQPSRLLLHLALRIQKSNIDRAQGWASTRWQAQFGERHWWIYTTYTETFVLWN